jgi:hypothetical protein
MTKTFDPKVPEITKLVRTRWTTGTLCDYYDDERHYCLLGAIGQVWCDNPLAASRTMLTGEQYDWITGLARYVSDNVADSEHKLSDSTRSFYYLTNWNDSWSGGPTVIAQVMEDYARVEPTQ